MGIVQRFERKLQGAVGDAFARVFGGGVVPQEVEAALQQEASDRIQQLDGGHLLAPNSYVIAINNSDHEELAADRDLTVKAFARHLEDFIRDQAGRRMVPFMSRSNRRLHCTPGSSAPGVRWIRMPAAQGRPRRGDPNRQAVPHRDHRHRLYPSRRIQELAP